MIAALPKLRRPRPADWGVGMTVCLAAIANCGASIIVATDQMVSTEIMTADGTAIKIFGIHPNWAVMFSGEVGHVAPILYQVRENLSGNEPSCEEVESVISHAYQERLQAQEENAVLSRYKLTMKQFLADGLNKFGASNFSRLLQRIEQVSLGVDFLVAGYDSKGGAHIFTVSEPGKADNHDVLGFAVVGSGEYVALSSLYFRKYSRRMPSEEALFYVCEAKFMAERALGVGPNTSVLRIEPGPGGGVSVEELMDINSIRKIWEREATPRTPRRLQEKLRSVLTAAGATQRAFLGPPRTPVRKSSRRGTRDGP